MSYLFGSPRAGWRHEPQRPQQGSAQLQRDIAERLAVILALPPSTDEAMNERRSAFVQRCATRSRVKYSAHKRPPQALRRANPRSLSQLEDRMRDLMLRTAAERKLDVSKSYWMLKAEVASLLKVPEHFITQIFQKWNRLGACDQGVDNGMHDTHRDRSWGGPWVSSWQDTRYTVRLDKLIELGSHRT